MIDYRLRRSFDKEVHVPIDAHVTLHVASQT